MVDCSYILLYSAVMRLVTVAVCALPQPPSSTMVSSHSIAKMPLESEKSVTLLTFTAMSCLNKLFACATMVIVGVPPDKLTFVAVTADISEAKPPEKVNVYGPPALPVTVQLAPTVESNWKAVLTVADVKPAE